MIVIVLGKTAIVEGLAQRIVQVFHFAVLSFVDLIPLDTFFKFQLARQNCLSLIPSIA